MLRSGRPRPGRDTGPVATAKIEVRLRPRSGADELLGFRDGVLQARVKAPPVDGRANDALCRLIAKRLGLPRSRVEVVRGARGRDKLVAVEGREPAALRRALAARG